MTTDFSNAQIIELDGHNLDINQLYKIAITTTGSVKVVLSSDAKQIMAKSRAFVFEIIKKGKPVYGINTGFGALSNHHIAEQDLAQLQVNLIRSHCTGVGEYFSIKTTRAIMTLRANCLASGFSGVNPKIVELLLDFINYGITPLVPQQGSVGASGDLAPLSHIALALIGEGEVLYKGQEISALSAIEAIEREPIVLGPKDGLALINGTAVMTALAGLAVYDATNILKLADIASCLTLDGVKGTRQAYHPAITALKPHLGQKDCCENLNRLIKDSAINHSHDDCNKVQDPYSLRCVPQVHGACRQTYRHALEVVNTELNAVTDNPLIFLETGEVISGGNFHGEAIAMAMDYLAIGLAEICNISERRIEKMMNPTFSELPAFLVKNSGLNSGLMIAHVTAAALVSENKGHCHPASIDSVPTSTDKEDHVSMGPFAGRKLHKVLENCKYCLAIELLCNTQALDFQRPLKSSPALEVAYSLIREHVPTIEQDRYFAKDIKAIYKLVDTNQIVTAVEEVLGKLN